MNPITGFFAACLAMSFSVPHAASAADASETKRLAFESTSPFPTLQKWLNPILASPINLPADIHAVNLGTISKLSESEYQPLPVIMGLPDLPLIGQTGQQWSRTLNYQGMHMSLIMSGKRGRHATAQPMSTPIASGTAFRIRITATFDAIADIDTIAGTAWYGTRKGHVYPAQGMSVQLRAGETIYLPIDDGDFFTLGNRMNERFVISVRHAMAIGDKRNDQPTYRQDSSSGSSYLQLVPAGRQPIFEQLLSRSS